MQARFPIKNIIKMKVLISQFTEGTSGKGEEWISYLKYGKNSLKNVMVVQGWWVTMKQLIETSKDNYDKGVAKIREIEKEVGDPYGPLVAFKFETSDPLQNWSK